MDRRRFVPSPEGLEGRALLSTVVKTSVLATTPNTSSTLREKDLRIERLPFFLEKLQPGRTLPAATLARLQADLKLIEARLQPPPTEVLDTFNVGLRDVVSQASLSAADALTLNRLFGTVLDAAGAPPQAVANLQEDMNELAKVDSNSREPVMLATNDYALVIQTALAIGRPIRSPATPILARADIVRGQTNMVTTNHQPSVVGTYEPGHTIQILDPGENVLGSGPVASDGKYSVTFARPLNDGSYTVRVIALDSMGHISSPSRPLTFRVVTRAVPRGPLALGSSGR